MRFTLLRRRPLERMVPRGGWKGTRGSETKPAGPAPFCSSLQAAFAFACAATVACGSATWDDTFTGSDTRTTSVSDTDAAVTGDGGFVQSCDSVAASSAPVAITVTFPGHGTSSETIHVATATASCDLAVDTDTDGVVFVSDTSPCAKLIAPGTPVSGTATASGGSAPNDLLFQWSYGIACTITDEYALSKE